MRHRLRPMTFGLIILVLSFSAIGVLTAAAQTISVRPPTILIFTASTPTISLSAVERGEATTTLLWRIADYDDILRVGIDQLVMGDWLSILTEGETLGGQGTREVIIDHPGNFAPLTYRLTVSNPSGELLTQQIKIIDYQVEAAAPAITSFTTSTAGLDTAALLQRNALAAVSWTISNRTPTSNLRFEQVLGEQDVITVELPRESLWWASEGTADVAPDVPLTEAVVRLRLSVVDMISGDVYDSAELTLPLTGEPLPIPGMGTPFPTTEATAAPTTTDAEATAVPTTESVTTPPTDVPTTADGSPRVVVFSAMPTTARAGESIIVSWNVENAVAVSVQEQAASGAAGLLYIELPSTGALSLRMPENSGGMIYILRARGADGTEVTAEVTVIQGT